jgi:hypothetical protein
VVPPHFRRDAKVSAQESGPELSNQFLEGIAVAAEAVAVLEPAIEPGPSERARTRRHTRGAEEVAKEEVRRRKEGVTVTNWPVMKAAQEPAGAKPQAAVLLQAGRCHVIHGPPELES